MPAITLTNLDEDLLAGLESLAKQHGHPVEVEIRVILKNAIAQFDPAWERINQRRERLAASGRVSGNSIDLLREDRER